MSRAAIARSQLAALLMAVVVWATSAFAGGMLEGFITGSIGFDGEFAPDNPILGDATEFSFPAGGEEVTVGEQFGSYASVPDHQVVTFADIAVSPASPPSDPLWTFTVSGVIYSFKATTIAVFFNSALNIWNLGGDGTAMITGFQDTPGTWNLTLAGTGSSFAFASTAGVIPEPSTMMLASLGLAVLCMTYRQMKK